jgi:VWFA-related protein
MARLLTCCLVASLTPSALTFQVLAQTSPQPQAMQSSQGPGKPVATLRARAGLVVVDVVVTDSKKSPVHDLKITDFTLLENKVPQQIKTFEEHSAIQPAVMAKLAPMPAMPPGIFTNFSPLPATGAINVVLLDSLNTPMKDQAYVRAQLIDYIKKMPPGARIAIFGLTNRLIILQGFTSDPAVLMGALTGKVRPQASTLLNDPVSGGPSTDTSVSDAMSNVVGNDPVSAQALANVQQFEAFVGSFQLQLRAKYTLDAMNQLARYLVDIPGRKNLIWFSGSFPLDILPDTDLADPFAVMADSEDEYRETTNLLARSQVAVYPIDARGLFNSPVLSAANPGKNYARNPQAFAKDQSKFFQQTASEHDTMHRMAQDTGGQAFVNTNGLSQAVAQAIESGSNYYTLSYAPIDGNWNGSFRKIQVQLARQGYTLAYRRGYYADDPDAPSKHVSESAATAPPRSTFNMALMRGGPDQTQIIFKVRVILASAATEETVAERNHLNPDPKANAKGPFRRYLLDFAADPRAIAFATGPEGNYHCAIEVVTFVYDHDGTLINSTATASRASLPPAAYVSTMRVGFPFHQEISVPVKGEYYLRTAIHDTDSDRVGAVEIPVGLIPSLPAPVAAK